MSDFACQNSPSRIVVNIVARDVSIARTIFDIMSYILVKKLTPTDRYSSRYGTAKLDVTTTNFEPSFAGPYLRQYRLFGAVRYIEMSLTMSAIIRRIEALIRTRHPIS
jgi:hypothetical protein